LGLAVEQERGWQTARRHVRIFPVHFARTFSMQRLGPHDPTAELVGDCFRKAFFYRGAAGAVEICRERDGEHDDKDDGLLVSAFGPEAERLLEETVRGLSQDDGYADFMTEDTGVLRLHRSLPGLRLLRMPWLYDMTCSAILQQRIRTVDAMRDWRRIAQRYGSAGPLGLRVFPPAEVLARVPLFALEQMGIDGKRARTLLKFAREMAFVRLDGDLSFQVLRERLLRVPGIGPWTAESVLGYGAGDPDAAIPGDLHLPRVVCYALAGEPGGTDERMMELLEPFRGHRFRIIRLLYAAGLDVPW
jgi:3-methyladenine DNA glycosylase/8-oxoguanine DNA glycosylase